MRVASRQVPYYDEKGYDAMVVNEEIGLFGVFDGMGTSEQSRNAALVAAQIIEDRRPTFVDALVYSMNDLIRAGRAFGNGGTTATVLAAGNYLHYAHIGDSRLYVLTGNRLKQITADEGIGNILYNYVGQRSLGLAQLGQIQKWDRFMLCTDGVTGDWEEQFIPEDKLESIMLDAKTPEEAVDQILEASSKSDDKSIIVGFKE
jgi:serine/threonine protein phosphatase PrpC